MSTPVSAQGWHQRATPASSEGFEPRMADLVLLARFSAMAIPDGFTMALLRPNLAVDGMGRLLTLEANDFAALEAQGRAVSQNVAGGYWRVRSLGTCRTIDTIVICGDLETRRVYGWKKSDHALELEAETAGGTTLPTEFQVLVGWAREALEDYKQGGKKDNVLIGMVKALIE